MKKKSNFYNHLFNFLGIIIGVYLAFYLNDRANLKQEKNESIELMKSLIIDLEDDMKTYEDYQIPENIKHQKNIIKLINFLTQNNIDSINYYMPTVFQVENFAPTTSTYNSLTSSGKLSLIKSFAVRKNLSDFYEGTAKESSRKGEFQVEFFTNELLSWVIENVDIENMRLLKGNENIVFKNKLIIYESLIAQKVESYEMIVERSKELKFQIETAINSN